MRLVRYAELPEVPWSNGLGLTREIGRSSEGLDSVAYDWRISIARIDGDAPFSPLPGIDRSLMALGKDGVTLVVGDGDAQHLGLHDILRFEGEDDVRPVGVMGSNFDLNLMTRRDTASGNLSRVTVTGETTVGTPAGDTSVVVLLDGELTVKNDRHRECRLQLFDAVIATAGDLPFSGMAVVALVQVH